MLASFHNDHELYHLKPSFLNNERMCSTCLFSAMPFTEKNNSHCYLKNFRDSTKFGVFQHINGSQVWLDIIAIIILNNTSTLKRSLRQLMFVAEKFQYGIFFFLMLVGASRFAKAGKKNKILPDFKTAFLLSFYILYNIPCLSFTTTTML